MFIRDAERFGRSAIVAAVALAASVSVARAQAVPVRLVHQADGSWQLLRDGKPYFIRGAGGDEYLDTLKACGGNSIRTWGADKAQRDLDAAQAQGLTVTVGVWLGHREHGFHYDDPQQVAKQYKMVQEVVGKIKDHPALLIWGLGNEAEGGGEDTNYWKALEDIARMVKRADPDHPTMTVIAEIGRDGIKAKQVAALCPDIDILGVNSYGGLGSLPQRLKAAGWTKPYIVTEFGPNGQWEVGKTAWGAPLELTSTEKAKQYAERYRTSIADRRGWCLGSYAFVWGDKVEATPTWYGLFLHSGERLGAVDALQQAWTGQAPAHPVPAITSVSSSMGTTDIPPGSSQSVIVGATGEGPLRVRYEIRPEAGDHQSHEPGQETPAAISGSVPAEDVWKAGATTFTVPTRAGAYRLYITIRDSHGGAATANLPFRVYSGDVALHR